MSDRYRFAFNDRYSPLLRLLGVRPERAHVQVTDRQLEARFGPWLVRTSLANIEDVQITGPHRPIKAIGPRMAPSTGNLTFGSNAERTVRITFQRPVTGLDPLGILHHPSLSVSVADPEALEQRLNEATAAG